MNDIDMSRSNRDDELERNVSFVMCLVYDYLIS